MYIRIAGFIRHYGMSAYMNELYQTDDKIIPFKQFFLMETACRATLAQERIGHTDATALAIGVALNGESPAIRTAIKRNTNEAYGNF